MILRLCAVILCLLRVRGGFLVIAGGAAFGGMAVLLGGLIAAFGGFRVVLGAGFGRGLRCLGSGHDMSPVFCVSLCL
jgi:hypothetical protein